MSELWNKDYLQTCRLCLNSTVVKINIFTGDFAKMIEILTSIRVRPNDKYPQVSCLKCAKQVKTAFLVRRHIIKSHQLLTNHVRMMALNRHSESIPNPVHVGNPSSILEISSCPDTLNQSSRLHLSGDIIQANGAQLMSQCAPRVGAQSNDSLLPQSTEIGESFEPIEATENGDHSSKSNSPVCDTTNNRSNHEVNLINQPIKERRSSKTDTSLPALSKKREPLKTFCNICQIEFSKAIHYRNHMAKHKHKVCPICNKQIGNAYFKRHLTLHEDAPAMCELCGITCKNPASLKMHIVYYHQANMSVCEGCGRSFRTKAKLFYHQRKDHIKERKHKCETCGKCFFTKWYLTKHINMKHNKMRPHICEYCGKGFSGKHALRTHIRQHTNEAPFHCEFCGKSFRQRVSLKGHLKTHHHVEEENTTFCDKCGKGFTNLVALNAHTRLHTELKCSWCSDTFAETAYLKQHISIVHPKKYTDNPEEVLRHVGETPQS